ncbi:MAG: hypothetical protein U1F35_17670 [Steroidobacteraceae bacterium]
MVEDKTTLMLSWATTARQLQNRLESLPPAMAALGLELAPGGTGFPYTPSMRSARPRDQRACCATGEQGIDFRDLHTSESSLEDIFVSLVQGPRPVTLRQPRCTPARTRWLRTLVQASSRR